MILKTLKDLHWKLAQNTYGKTTDVINKEILKQESIKHINYIKTHKPFIEWEMVEVINPEAKPLLKQVLTSEGKCLIDYLKYLFNITENDLK